MSLKSRLSRLPAQLARTEAGTGGTPGQPAMGAGRPPPEPGPPPLGPEATSEGGGRDDPFALTQAMLRRLAGAPEPGPRADELKVEAYFSQEPSRHGPVSLRRCPPPAEPAARRIQAMVARRAAQELLSLLALDPSLREVDPARLVYFDTETSGLGGAGSVAFLVGLAFFDATGELVLEQYLMSSPEQELALLERVRERFEWASGLVSFNGKSFDLPLLQGRCVMQRLPELPRRPHLDLLHVARRIHKGRFSRFTLKHLELEVLGFARPPGDIPGAEIPPRYGHFLRTGDFSGLVPVMLHNEWDVQSLVALVAVYGEPLAHLERDDVLGAARTLGRARAFDDALELVEAMMATEPTSEALAVRARLQKARGDRSRALADFERLAREVKEPAIALELAKLYEHYARDYQSALLAIAEGTGESPSDWQRRHLRLSRKARAKREP